MPRRRDWKSSAKRQIDLGDAFDGGVRRFRRQADFLGQA